MKTKLLLFVSLLWASFAVAQANAFTPPNIHQCGYEVFDLTVQNAVILGSQNPSQYSVTYFTSNSNAQANVNPVANPSSYVSPATQVIFARVTNSVNNTFAVTSFTLTWVSGQGPVIFPMPDVTACDAYALPALSIGNYFTGPNGTGNMLTAGILITQTALIYVYANQSGCTSQTSFMVTIAGSPQVNVQDVSACSSYVLPPLPAGVNYFTGPNGTGLLLEAGQTIEQSMTIYVYSQIGPCASESSFSIFIGEIVANDLNPYESCSANGLGTFDLTTVILAVTSNPAAEVSFFTTLVDAQANANPIDTSSPFISPTATIFVRVQVESCFAIVPLQLISNTCTDNYIYGLVYFDAENNGCGQGNDAILPNVALTHTFQGQETTIYTSDFGYYNIPNVQSGTNTIAVDPTSLPAGVALASSAQTFEIGNDDLIEANFCTNGVLSSDTSIYIIQVTPPVPGFYASYRIGLANISLQNVSASVTITFDNTKLTFNNATLVPSAQTANTVTFAVPAIVAMMSSEFDVHFYVAQPPTANSGDILTLTASSVISPADSNTANNSITIEQIVTNSFDPNDITVHEGTTITPTQAQDYLHYTINFQNLGTASAQTVRIENVLDANMDWSTFRPIASSHFYRAERQGSDIIFYFDDIQLAASQDNEIESHGFVTYKIKPIPGIAEGNSVVNHAGIFFDFNPVVETNTVVTTVQSLSVDENSFDGFSIFPNPTNGVFTIRALNVTQLNVEVLDARGAKVFSRKVALQSNESLVDVSGLGSGLYFVKLTSENASVIKKILVK